MDAEQIKILVEAAVTAVSNSQVTNNRELIEAAVNAAARNNTQANQTMRKPTLPPFDTKNIESWLRRIDAAFDRLNITDPKLKFANLDEKILSDQDPVIDDFMAGPPTTANWDNFVAYLRKKHGRTTKQKAASIIEGVERDGRCPSQLWSVMVKQAGDVTLDDVMKEQLIRRLPQDVRRHLRDRMDGKTGKEVSKMADEYYGKDGKLLDNKDASTINAVCPSSLRNNDHSEQHPSTYRQAPRQPESAGFTPTFSDEDEGDINAVRFKQGHKQRFSINNRSGQSASRGCSSYSNNSSSNYNQNSSSRYNNNNENRKNSNSTGGNKDSNLCFYHNKYGDKAEKCAEGCTLYSKHQSGNARASR